ncbi:integrin alpha-10 isoform X1 [Canis lupus familiaris]|uniref:integrin alpha-10 isoform X1 n=1 Tax=Canis lupus familiaris TaxID=9615 RepID=UPI0015F13966|nr:integrin alpha-10 isoform X1 [Canis lupus familiaris]XP_038309366.1 integrin alpha-10 isoform X1 [Canis lupus familiaris]XP_038417961.1 integrin alpha-10 isoform X1 [Canis lupus familiaris]
MELPLIPHLLLPVVFLTGLCSPFNLDVHHPRLFPGPPEAEFGYSVLQHVGGGRRWMLVGAPWDGPSGDRRGDVYRCPVGGSHSAPCAKGHLGDYPLGNSSHPAVNMHLGMSLLETDNDGGFMVTKACAPLWSRACGSSVFSSGICARVDASFRPQGSLAPTAQRCPTYMDVVIVLDGSNSIYPWSEVQTFLRRLVGRLFIDPEQVQVGLVQYGESPVHEWSLGDFRTKEEVVRAARNLSRREGRETKTAQAILVACTEGFSLSRGGRPEAARLLVVVTDGESHDGEELPAALKACEAGRVTRYGIAVLGHYLRRQRDPTSFLREIRMIANDPDERFFFNVTDEAALTDIVDALGDRIFGLEGSHGENESSFGLEMSQIGFSTHRLKDGILFGMVGAYDWGGSVLWLEEGHHLFPPRTALEDEFPPAFQNHAAYLGYSVSSMLLRGGRRLFLSGAPRFRHRGKVIAFQLKKDGAVRVAQSLQGEQIGSYFGSELCPLDTDGDGTTNVLLVAAPMFLGPQNKETGRVYVYLVGQQSLLTLQGTLQPEPPQDARFGFAMGAIPDLNQDGFADVAVGAPLEDGHHGALYLYHGTQSGIRPRPAQRIAAISMPQALSYFGRSVDGRLDLDGDDLVDVAVGAQGAAVLLSSRPIVHLGPSLEVTPPAISVVQKNCSRRGQEAACLSAALCFQVTSRTPGRWNRRFYLRFTASLDEWTAGARAVFDGSGQRLSPRRLQLSVGNVTCEQLRFHVLDTSDYLRPLALTVTFALDNTTKPGPVLDEGSPTSIQKLVPFSKDCGPDNECITDLVLQASVDIRGSRRDPFVVRGGRQKVLVSATLENRKENAYNTSLSLSFSRNLHLASFTSQRDSPVKVECAAPSPHVRLCSVAHPVFRTGAKVTFLLEFEFSCSSLLSQVLVRLTASSNSLEKNGTLQDNTAQISAYIQYEPHLLFSSESTLHRYEVHPYGTLPVGPEFKTTLRVQNLGCYVVSGLIISAFLPAVAHGGNYFLSLSQVVTNNASCTVQNLTEPPQPPVHPEEFQYMNRLNGSNTRCQVVRCHLGRLAKGTEVSVGLLRLVHNEFFRRAKFKSLTVVSTFELGAKEGSVLRLPEASRWSESLLEVIQTRPVLISLWILIGSVLGGLLLLALLVFCLWKLGFFTRKKIPEEEKREGKLEQ